ncbi:hypothetical protein DMA11_13740 [Marinilabiliaceae bacterium JC017]|nr:hypothetical protein DMA11_13740 [Marinilabiliaceae bacterium JC017]
MSKLWKKDGLSQRKRRMNAEISGFFRIFENDIHILTGRAMQIARFLRYYSLQNQPDGYFNEVLEKNALIVLMQINLLDVDGEESVFQNVVNHDYHKEKEKHRVLITIILKLIRLFDLWLLSISRSELNGQVLSLHKDIRNQISVNLKLPAARVIEFTQQEYPELHVPSLRGVWRGGKEIQLNSGQPLYFLKSTFYRLISSVKLLQDNAETYYQEIITAGDLDPSVSLLMGFLKNYSSVTANFNHRWQEYPSFYLDKILKAQPKRIVPDFTYLMFKLSPSAETVFLEKGTEFIGGKDSLGLDIRYKSQEETIVNNVSLEKVYNLFLEKDQEIVPARDFKFVTAIRKIDISQYVEAEPGSFLKSQPHSLFENKGKKSINEINDVVHYTSVGMMIESWALLLREGSRHVTLRFQATSKSSDIFKAMIKVVSEQWETSEREAVYKVLKDIFYLEISTTEGWHQIENYAVDYETTGEKKGLRLNFSLPEVFPPTSPCSEIHHVNGSCNAPALKVLINRDSWLFPFSWLKDFEIEKVKIEAEVFGATQVQIYNELGQLDNGMAFYPFGAIPRKGSWLVVGNYEMALKNIRSVDLNLKWLQLPGDDYGFFDYYQHYGKEIDNCSFRVKAQVLNNRKWEDVTGRNSFFLFNTVGSGNEASTLPRAPLAEQSVIKEIRLPDFGMITPEEDKYRYSVFAKSGFIRLLLTAPEMGFGHQEYQNILTDALIQKVRSKNLVPMPKPPFSPQLEKIEVNYHSNDEINMSVGESVQKSRIYHLFPYGEQIVYPKTMGQRLKFFPDLGNTGNLLFGLKNVKGGETITLFIDFLPREKEINNQQLPIVKWYWGDGYNWEKMPDHLILGDSTRNLLESGLIEIRLPKKLPDRQSSVEGLYWLRAGIDVHAENVSNILGFYLNVSKVQLDISGPVNNDVLAQGLPAGSITKAVRRIPGIAEIIQIVPSMGGKIKETPMEMRIRLSERISHRHRAVTPADYEKLVLETFPQVQKVKCLPGLDSKGQRRGVVTLVILQKQVSTVKHAYPKANCKLLLDIEEYLAKYASAFAIVDAINPVYEEIQVRCKVKLKEKRSDGYYIRKLNRLLNDNLAFWQKMGEAPVFGHTISLTDLANIIRGEEYVEHLSNFSVLHLKETGELVYELEELEESAQKQSLIDKEEERVSQRLNETKRNQRELEQISPSQPWAILVPAYRHLIVTDSEEQNDNAGIDDLEVGNTFVIG